MTAALLSSTLVFLFGSLGVIASQIRIQLNAPRCLD